MLSIGQIIEGKYRIESLLGEGAMGAVYGGEHTRIKRPVAIKVLLEKTPDAEAMRRFEREAEAAGRIGSDHIVEVLDFGVTPEGARYMVMEFLVGETLKQRMKRASMLAPTEIIPLLIQVLEGLSAAHDAGIIHRDLKPDNIFILREKAGRKDFVKIVDFGISKFNALSDNSGAMTQTGTVMGTPFYMSPEQAKSANEVDARSDLYAIGVILYEAITGARPFIAGTLTELLFKIVFEEPSHPSKLVPNIDPGLSAIIMKAFARDPADRYQSAREFQQALASWVPGQSVDSSAAPTALRPQATAPGPFSAAPTLARSPNAANAVQSYAPAQSHSVSMPGPSHQASQHAAGYGANLGSTRLSGSAVSPQVGSATLEPQQTWNRPEPKKSGAGGIVAMVGLLLVGALGAGWFFVGRGMLNAKTASTAGAETALTSSGATAEPTSTSPAVTPSVGVTATATANASSTPVASGAGAASGSPVASSSATQEVLIATPGKTGKPGPGGKPGATSSAKPSGTVSDLGY